MASKLWNSIPDSFRATHFPDFKCKILQYTSFQSFRILERYNFTILEVFGTINLTRTLAPLNLRLKKVHGICTYSVTLTCLF